MALTFKGRVVRDPDAQLNFEQLINTVSALDAADSAGNAAITTLAARVTALETLFNGIATTDAITTFSVTLVDNAAVVTLASFNVPIKGLYWASGAVELANTVDPAGRLISSLTFDPVTGTTRVNTLATATGAASARSHTLAIGPVICAVNDDFILKGQMNNIGANETCSGQLIVAGIPIP